MTRNTHEYNLQASRVILNISSEDGAVPLNWRYSYKSRIFSGMDDDCLISCFATLRRRVWNVCACCSGSSSTCKQPQYLDRFEIYGADCPRRLPQVLSSQRQECLGRTAFPCSMSAIPAIWETQVTIPRVWLSSSDVIRMRRTVFNWSEPVEESDFLFLRYVGFDISDVFSYFWNNVTNYKSIRHKRCTVRYVYWPSSSITFTGLSVSTSLGCTQLNNSFANAAVTDAACSCHSSILWRHRFLEPQCKEIGSLYQQHSFPYRASFRQSFCQGCHENWRLWL